MLPLSRIALPAALLSGAMAFAQTDEFRIYDKVEVRGAEFVPEDDIRLTCGDLAGVELDDIQLRSVEDCLMSTGVFESVRVRGQGDTLVIEVTEVETHPGRIDAGVAWVNDSGLTGTLSYEQFNLIPDTYLSIQSRYGAEYRSYALNLYREDAFGKGLHFGLDLAGEQTGFEDQSYSTRSDQIEAYLALPLQERSRLEFGLGYRAHRLFDVAASASPLLQLEAGEVSAPFLHVALAFRQGDEEAAHGLTLRLDQYLWNAGTEARVAETQVEANMRHDLGEKTSLHLGLRGGMVTGLGGYDTTALDRGFVGGETLRGFAARGIGPIEAGDHLGGNRYLAGSVEVQRPLGEAMGSAIKGGLFLDVGSVWGLDNTRGGAIDDSAHLRASVGLSVTFDVGKVPVSLYLATPVQDRPGDERQVFGLTAAARF